MDIHTAVSFKTITTMKVGGTARFFTEARTPQEVQAVYLEAQKQHLPIFIVGGGSNVIAHDDDFFGIIVRIRIPGFDIVADALNDVTIRIGAGENWDETVKKTVDMRLSGIEAMSAIPGTAGAAPVQNIGAYGQEVAETLVSLEAYDTQTNMFVTLQNADCGFAYRHSIFRGDAKGRYIITSITLKLSRNLPQAPFYEALQTYFDTNNITVFTHQSVRDAVIAIRTDKLPDPTVKPNSGSFFKNAIVDSWRLPELLQKFPDMKNFDMGDGTHKIPTGWLIETAGFKGQLLHGIRVNEKNCLVLINESAKSYSDLAMARDEIINKVRDTFQIIIEQEPLEIGS